MTSPPSVLSDIYGAVKMMDWLNRSLTLLWEGKGCCIAGVWKPQKAQSNATQIGGPPVFSCQSTVSFQDITNINNLKITPE